MNDTFTQDGWKKLKLNQMKEPKLPFSSVKNESIKKAMIEQENCFGEPIEEDDREIFKTPGFASSKCNQRQIDVAKKVRKSYEQLAFKEQRNLNNEISSTNITKNLYFLSTKFE